MKSELNPKAKAWTPQQDKKEQMATPPPPPLTRSDEEASRHLLQLLHRDEPTKKPPLVLPHMPYDLQQSPPRAYAPPLPPPQPVVYQHMVPQGHYQGPDYYEYPQYHYYNVYNQYQVCIPAALVQYHPLVYPSHVGHGGVEAGAGEDGVVDWAEGKVGFLGRPYFENERRGVRRFVSSRYRSQRGQSLRGWSRNSWCQWKPRMATNSVDGAVQSDCKDSFSPTPSLRKTSSDEGGATSAFDDVGVASCGKTTLMIKNVPNQFRRNTFLAFLDNFCCQENEKAKLHGKNLQFEYDFLYLPMDFRSRDNYGYAFVNFTTASVALRVKELLHNFKWGLVPTSKGFVESKKTCEIAWARIQGKDGLVNHFKSSNFSCFRTDYLPVVFSPPRNGATPLATTEAINIGKCKICPRRL